MRHYIFDQIQEHPIVRVCHNIAADFDDPNLIGTAGLVPVMALAGPDP